MSYRRANNLDKNLTCKKCGSDRIRFKRETYTKEDGSISVYNIPVCKDCAAKSKREREAKKRVVIDRVCKHCGEGFTPTNWQQVFCSSGCNRKWWSDSRERKKTELRCIVCGDLFVRPKGRAVTCSEQCSKTHCAQYKTTEYKNAHTDWDNCRATRKRYYQDNKDDIKRKSKEYHYDKMKNDPNYRMIFRLRQRLSAAVNCGFSSEWLLGMLGCTIDELRDHLQKTAEENGYSDFNIDDYSGAEYHIDHIKPLASFDLLNEVDQNEAMHYSNLQILTAQENMSKSAKIV